MPHVQRPETRTSLDGRMERAQGVEPEALETKPMPREPKGAWSQRLSFMEALTLGTRCIAGALWACPYLALAWFLGFGYAGRVLVEIGLG